MFVVLFRNSLLNFAMECIFPSGIYVNRTTLYERLSWKNNAKLQFRLFVATKKKNKHRTIVVPKFFECIVCKAGCCANYYLLKYHPHYHLLCLIVENVFGTWVNVLFCRFSSRLPFFSVHFSFIFPKVFVQLWVRLTQTHSQISMYTNETILKFSTFQKYGISHIAVVVVDFMIHGTCSMMCTDASKMKWKLVYDYVFSNFFASCIQCNTARFITIPSVSVHLSPQLSQPYFFYAIGDSSMQHSWLNHSVLLLLLTMAPQ